MARLNEPPAAPAATTAAATTALAGGGTETVDALKRRFIRQNRDLAKNNSTQSLRIRSLELEISRLLADNLELRNQVLQLQNEVYSAMQSRGAENAVMARSLRAKIAELSGIVEGMEDDEREEGEKIESAATATREKKPIEGNWRERQPLAELMRDSQMPTIAEDKLYPRRTLGADEIQAIRLSDHSSTNESPDLGPPPIAHFDYEDPVKNTSPLVNKKTSPGRQVAATVTATGTSSEEDELPASLSVNLETRRRRKDGQARVETRRHSLLAPPSSSQQQQQQQQSQEKSEPAESASSSSSSILRTGAKRKLSDREMEKPIKPPSKGDFTFSRKATATAGDTKAGGEELGENVEVASPLLRPARKILGDKSVNLSPRKTTAASVVAGKPEKEKERQPHEIASSRLKASSRDSSAVTKHRRRVSSLPLPSPPRGGGEEEEEEAILSTIEIAPPPAESESITISHISNPSPETPFAPPPPPDDIFSPTPSERSAKPPEGQHNRGDTPPPAPSSAISTTTMAEIGVRGARPSRRAARAAAVNYAEPSLIAKIRRPDKRMVDAVGGLRDPRRAMGGGRGLKEVGKAVRASGGVGGGVGGGVVVVKVEPRDDDDDGDDGECGSWRDLPLASATAAGTVAAADVGCSRHVKKEEAASPLHRKSDGDGVAELWGPDTIGTGMDVVMGSREGEAAAAAVDDSKPSASSATISALMANRSKRRQSSQPRPQPLLGTTHIDAATEKLQELDLYEFKESSSSPCLTDNGNSGGTEAAKPGRPRSTSSSSVHRRHSSVPKDVLPATATTPAVVVMDEGKVGVGERDRGERMARRRRSMML